MERKFVRTLLPQSLIQALESVQGVYLHEIMDDRKHKLGLGALLKEHFTFLLVRPAPASHARLGPVNHFKTSTQP